MNTQRTVAEVVRTGFPWCAEYASQLAELFRGYVAHKRGHALVDFDDLLLLWRAALADPVTPVVSLSGLTEMMIPAELRSASVSICASARALATSATGIVTITEAMSASWT